MSRLKNKMKDQNGFTLIEMLIVVAIIAILISVSIPMVSASLERARVATDAANERSAKAAALTAYLTGYYDGENKVSFGSGTSVKYKYDAANGKLVAVATTVAPYGKCSKSAPVVGSTAKNRSHINGYIVVEITKEGEVTITWEGEGCTGTGAHGTDIT